MTAITMREAAEAVLGRLIGKHLDVDTLNVHRASDGSYVVTLSPAGRGNTAGVRAIAEAFALGEPRQYHSEESQTWFLAASGLWRGIDVNVGTPYVAAHEADTPIVRDVLTLTVVRPRS